MSMNYDECGIVAATSDSATIGIGKDDSTFEGEGRHGQSRRQIRLGIL
jgi:hypothetical protein